MNFFRKNVIGEFAGKVHNTVVGKRSGDINQGMIWVCHAAPCFRHSIDYNGLVDTEILTPVSVLLVHKFFREALGRLAKSQQGEIQGDNGQQTDDGFF